MVVAGDVKGDVNGAVAAAGMKGICCGEASTGSTLADAMAPANNSKSKFR